ncbi:bis(5'-nucleosyl)-tetraphosphatase [Inmirania thermothiophila]|uniref:Bis(5'-nucleosyl)-tetraphosphatase [asymmetrical] n=1 Tax=Inmirania thermothiophila TaxID=1750597 RepID=A0A3N1Y9K2_9GAMM|nr:bis(5'-nucleosyl)-tetraphosphatase [Inmirania thermothiophila]ROR34292.1 8-oxo-dGTP pyrophosphatase MutT (NUDIX family) [Inmirania thermothiophila]
MARTPPHAAPRLSAGFVLVRRGDGGWRYLMLRAYRNWDFPKGLVEPGESPLEAARREVAEETGLDELVLRWGEDYVETGPYGRGKVARYYLAEAPRGAVVLPVSPELGRPEHDEYRWVDLAEALRLAPPRLVPVLAWAADRIGDPQRAAST